MKLFILFFSVVLYILSVYARQSPAQSSQLADTSFVDGKITNFINSIISKDDEESRLTSLALLPPPAKGNAPAKNSPPKQILPSPKSSPVPAKQPQTAPKQTSPPKGISPTSKASPPKGTVPKGPQQLPPQPKIGPAKLLNSLPPANTVIKKTNPQCSAPKSRKGPPRCSCGPLKRSRRRLQTASDYTRIQNPDIEAVIRPFEPDASFDMDAEHPSVIYWGANQDGSRLRSVGVCGCSIVVVASPLAGAGMHVSATSGAAGSLTGYTSDQYLKFAGDHLANAASACVDAHQGYHLQALQTIQTTHNTQLKQAAQLHQDVSALRAQLDQQYRDLNSIRMIVLTPSGAGAEVLAQAPKMVQDRIRTNYPHVRVIADTYNYPALDAKGGGGATAEMSSTWGNFPAGLYFDGRCIRF